MKEYTTSQLAKVIGVTVSRVLKIARDGLLNYRRTPMKNDITFPVQWNYGNIQRIKNEMRSFNKVGDR